jgi:hypothetical protein
MNMLVSNGAWVQYAENYYQRATGFGKMAEVYQLPGGVWALRVWQQFKAPDRRTGNTGRMILRGTFPELKDAFEAGESHIG